MNTTNNNNNTTMNTTNNNNNNNTAALSFRLFNPKALAFWKALSALGLVSCTFSEETQKCSRTSFLKNSYTCTRVTLYENCLNLNTQTCINAFNLYNNVTDNVRYCKKSINKKQIANRAIWGIVSDLAK